MNVLIIGSDTSVQGGMVSVIKNYLEYGNWKEANIHFVPTYVEKSALGKSIFFLRSLGKIKKTIKKEAIELAHIHVSERGSFWRKAIVLKLCKRRGVKVIFHHHGAEFQLFYSNSSAGIKRRIQKVLAEVDMHIVLSRRLIPMITDIVPQARVKYLYNAVKTYQINPYKEDGSGILFLGRLGQRKGAYDLLEAIRQLDKELPPKIHFYFCGDGEVDKVKGLSEEYGLEQRIAHIGWIDGAQKEKIFRNTILNVLPSYNEGLPMTILETMAYGIPNISTAIASIPEVIVNGENGILIEPGDVEALKQVIANCVKDKALRRRMSAQAFARISDSFGLETHIKLLEQYYGETLAES